MKGNEAILKHRKLMRSEFITMALCLFGAINASAEVLNPGFQVVPVVKAADLKAQVGARVMNRD